MYERTVRDMSLKELAEHINARLDAKEPFIQQERLDLHEALGNHIAWAGQFWDLVDGTDSMNGPVVKYGTRNRRSMTYKCRKLAGYSYP